MSTKSTIAAALGSSPAAGPFSADGYDSASGWVPTIRIQGARFALSVASAALIEQHFDAFMQAALDACDPDTQARLRVAKDAAKAAKAAKAAPAPVKIAPNSALGAALAKATS